MTSSNTNKKKGDRAERELAELLTILLGRQVRRQLGAGRTTAAGGDVGDLDGIPHWTIQVADWADVSAAALRKPTEAEAQRINAGSTFAATFIRFRGGRWRAVLTPHQLSVLIHHTLNHGPTRHTEPDGSNHSI